MESPTCIELQIRHVLGHPSNEYVYIWGLSDWVLAQNLIIEICFSYFILCSSPDLRKDNTGPGLCPISPSGGVECVLNKGAAGLSCLKTVQISHPCSEHITPLSYLPPLSLHYTLHCKMNHFVLYWWFIRLFSSQYWLKIPSWWLENLAVPSSSYSLSSV